jgi:hypothetical protein
MLGPNVVEPSDSSDSEESFPATSAPKQSKTNFNKSYLSEDHADGSNVIINYAELCSMINTYVYCKKCFQSKNDSTFNPSCTTNTVGIATTITVESCDNRNHDIVMKPERVMLNPAIAEQEEMKSPRRESIASFSVNVLAVLAAQMLGHGYGKTISTFAGCFGIPFHIANHVGWRHTENLLGRLQQNVTKKICEKNILEEVRLTREAGIERKENGDLGLAVSMDMGWQVRSSGRTYASNSGHNLCIGCRSGKILDYLVLSRTCSVCVAAKKQKHKPKEHICVQNHEGSSKSMEPLSTCEIATRLYRRNVEGGNNDSNCKVYVDQLLTDDDSTTRSNMAPVGTRKKDKGRLPPDVPQPTKFLTDPSHRTRVYAGHFFKLVNHHGMKPGHALRFKKYFAFAVHQYNHEDLPRFRNRMKASVEHVFNNHEFCDNLWCRYKDGVPESNPEMPDEPIIDLSTVSESPLPDEADPHPRPDSSEPCQGNGSPPSGDVTATRDKAQNQENVSPPSDDVTETRDTTLQLGAGHVEKEGEMEKEGELETENEQEIVETGEVVVEGPFLSKTGNPLLYEAIKKIQDTYLSDKNLLMLLHPWTTQKNEAMNTCIAKLAPKDQTHSHTPDLGYRVALAVGFKSVGWVHYLSEVFSLFRHESTNPLPPTTTRMLAVKQTANTYSVTYKGQIFVKIKRRATANEKIKVQKVFDTRARANHTDYKSGIGVAGDEENENDSDIPKEPVNKKRKAANKVVKDVTCKWCNKRGHSRRSHTDCDCNPKKVKSVVEEAESACRS